MTSSLNSQLSNRILIRLKLDLSFKSLVKVYKMGQMAALAKSPLLHGLSVAALSAIVSPLPAHELWVSPQQYTVEMGEQISANVRNGENFDGDLLRFDPSRVRRLSISDAEGLRTANTQAGSDTTFAFVPRQSGMQILAYESVLNTVSYSKLPAFESFAREVGHDWAIAAQRSLHKPDFEIIENYFRYAKSLVQVGEISGSDQLLGMELELTAVTNPYVNSPDRPLEIKLYYQSKPLAGNQIAIFARSACKTLRVTSKTSSSSGSITIPGATPGEYMISAIQLRPASEQGRLLTGASWESLWASLTFEVPGNNHSSACDL
jgi:uncharacterized GH25 family protein